MERVYDGLKKWRITGFAAERGGLQLVRAGQHKFERHAPRIQIVTVRGCAVAHPNSRVDVVCGIASQNDFKPVTMLDFAVDVRQRDDRLLRRCKRR